MHGAQQQDSHHCLIIGCQLINRKIPGPNATIFQKRTQPYSPSHNQSLVDRVVLILFFYL